MQASVLLLLFFFLIYSRLLVIRWRSYSTSRSQQQIKAIYPSTLRKMHAVLISVIFCSSVADGWPGSNWSFWTNPFLIVPNTPVTTDNFCPHFPHPAHLDPQVFVPVHVRRPTRCTLVGLLTHMLHDARSENVKSLCICWVFSFFCVNVWITWYCYINQNASQQYHMRSVC